MKPILALLVAFLLTGAAFGQYRCVDGEKVTFTDRPCADDQYHAPPSGNSPKVVGDSGNAAYSTLDGDWRGQVQYQVMQNGQPLTAAHAIVPLVLSIEPQGKIKGVSQENGCQLKGIAAPGPVRNMLTIDVTLSGCRYKDFNRRLTGTMMLVSAQKHVQFRLYAVPVRIGRPAQSFEIKGTLRR